MKGLKDLKIEEKLELYEKVKKLRKKGLSYEEIVKSLKVKVDPTTLSRWCRGLGKPTGSSLINVKPSPEFSYFLGALMGDGNIRKRIHNYQYEIRLRVQDKDFAILFAKAISKIVNKKIKLRKEKDFTRCGERFLVSLSNKRLWEFLVSRSTTQLIRIAEKFPRWFLRGLFDAEGSSSSGVEFSNTNLVLIKEVSRLLRSLGINHKIKLKIKKGQKVKIRNKLYIARKNLYTIRISRKEDIRKFATLVGFGIKRKQKKIMSSLK